MTRYLTRDRIAVLAAFVAPLALTAVLVPFRPSFPNTDAALALLLVVVAVAANGYRLAGYIAAVSVTVWFDFFLTQPYERFTITRRTDIETTVLLLLIGVAVTEIAVWGRRQRVTASRRAGYLDGINSAARAVAAGGSASVLTEQVAGQLTPLLSLRSCTFQYGVADIVTGGLVLAVVTSLPNAVSAVYLARRGRGAAVLSTALNSNAINVVAGLLIPACLAGVGPASGQDNLVAAWYAGLTVVALALAYRGRGLGRASGMAIIAGYLAFVIALVIAVEQGAVRPATAVFPAAVIAAAGALLLTWPAQWRTVPVRPGGLWQRESVLPGWSTGRLWRLSLIVCAVVAAGDAASGPHLILIGLLIAGPCCALLTARWALTAAASGFAVVLGVVLGVPDQIFATVTQYAFLAAVAAVGTTATVGAAVLQRQRP